MPGLTPGRWLPLAALLLVVAAASGCGEEAQSQDPVNRSLSCASPVVSVSLGRPGTSNEPARFRTDGAPFYLSASGFEHGGPFDPEVGRTTIYLGRSSRPPTFDAQRNKVTNVEATFDLQEGEKKQTRLPAGRYWLWSSNTVTVHAEACSPSGISGVTPSP